MQSRRDFQLLLLVCSWVVWLCLGKDTWKRTVKEKALLSSILRRFPPTKQWNSLTYGFKTGSCHNSLEPYGCWLLMLRAPGCLIATSTHRALKAGLERWATAQNHLWEAPRLPQIWQQLFGRNLLHRVAAGLTVESRFGAKLQALSWCSRMVLLWAELAQQWEGKNLKQIVPAARQWCCGTPPCWRLWKSYILFTWETRL